MFRSLPSVAVAAILALASLSTPAAAQQPQVAAANTLSTTVLFPASLVPAVTPAITAAVANEAAESVPVRRATAPIPGMDSHRPLLLPALYAAQGALQVMDAHSTYSAIGRGAHEANPLMQGVVKNRGAMLAVKAGVAASTIWMAESMWKRGNRVGAIATMIAANVVAAAVVAHNYQLAHRLQ